MVRLPVLSGNARTGSDVPVTGHRESLAEPGNKAELSDSCRKVVEARGRCAGIRHFARRKEGLTLLSSPGKSAKRVFAQNDRATQYSRDASDRTEKPRRTGSPAFAGDDSLCHSADRQRAGV